MMMINIYCYTVVGTVFQMSFKKIDNYFDNSILERYDGSSAAERTLKEAGW